MGGLFKLVCNYITKNKYILGFLVFIGIFKLSFKPLIGLNFLAYILILAAITLLTKKIIGQFRGKEFEISLGDFFVWFTIALMFILTWYILYLLNGAIEYFNLIISGSLVSGVMYMDNAGTDGGSASRPTYTSTGGRSIVHVSDEQTGSLVVSDRQEELLPLQLQETEGEITTTKVRLSEIKAELTSPGTSASTKEALNIEKNNLNYELRKLNLKLSDFKNEKAWLDLKTRVSSTTFIEGSLYFSIIGKSSAHLTRNCGLYLHELGYNLDEWRLVQRIISPKSLANVRLSKNYINTIREAFRDYKNNNT